MLKLFNLNAVTTLKNAKFIHTSCTNFIDQEYRRAMRLPRNPNAEGPLTNLPDFTYMDGRTTPLGRRQKKRILFQRELAQKIVQGNFEIDYAIDRHKNMKDAEVKATQDIIDSKLKPKGHLLLKKP